MNRIADRDANTLQILPPGNLLPNLLCANQGSKARQKPTPEVHT
jgi:hypothetical protein